MMSLNIKNERVCALARRAADTLGTTQTSALEQALEELLERHDEQRRRAGEQVAQERYARSMHVLERIDTMLTDADRKAMQRDLDEMYDEGGLPR
ncbi:type II toxin-antitoxin system VapB family antitoxin [Arsenicicoccus sp. UBA7492]|uniref:type II toxin-antitoxin system VapB family antitoxin n=1 Tax=Arsenicicoccus sp. UBA7492 TaxID=1946057 RepID=UPI00257EBA03|nr:type II toxin-antitoxin system VapB family antitoxin [Arsenicicoccus sp. UBA7492]